MPAKPSVFFTALLVAFLILPAAGFAQKTTLKGTITDSLKTALNGATVQWSDSSGRKISSATAGSDGSFSLNGLLQKKSYLIISYVQYGSKTILLRGDESDANLGTIELRQSRFSLTGVVVKGRRSPVRFGVDRQVYGAAQFNAATNGSAVDLIKNLPSVAVNGQGEISVRGSSSFQVMINNRPAAGDPAVILSQLSAASVENIEIISTPRASFDADGKSGIINIITKSAMEGGWMVQSNTMTGTPPLNDFDNKRQPHPQRQSVDVSAGYRKNRLDISTGANYLRNDIAGAREGDVYTILNGIKTSFPSTGDRSFKRYNYGGRFALGYQTAKGNRWDAGLFIGKRFQRRVADLLYNNTRTVLATNASTSFSYYNQNTQDKEGVFSLANLGYEQRLSATARLMFSAQYEGADLEGLTTNKNLNATDLTTLYQETRNPSTNPFNALRLKADLVKKTKKGSFSTGYQIRRDNQNGNFIYLTKNGNNGSFVTDPLFTSAVKMKNLIHAGYVQNSAFQGKFFHQEGLRFEHLTRDLEFSPSNEKRKLLLPSLFPSFLLRYNLQKTTVLKAGYSRRVKRTNNFELNPFPEREHSETLEQGDPELLPELTGILETGLERSWQGGSFYGTLYYQTIKNPIQRVNKVFNDTILNRVFTNAGQAVQYGVELSFTQKAGKIWQLVAGGNLYRYSINGGIFGGSLPVSRSGWVYSLNFTNTFNFEKNITLQFTLNYLSRRVTALGEDGSFLTPNLSLKKTSKNQRWSGQIQWLNIDMGAGVSNRQRITTSGLNFYTTTNYIYEPDQLQFSVGFNLSKKNRKISLPVSEMAEKEF